MRFSKLVSAFMLGASALLATSRASAQNVVFYENFTPATLQAWTLGTEWQVGTATPSISGNCGGFTGDPAVDADGTPGGFLAGVVIGGLSSTAIHGDRSLESPIIPLAPGTTTLTFSRWLQSDYLPYMSNSVSVFDGTNWVVLFSTTSTNTCFADTSWQMVSFDVSAYANPNFRVRFSFAVGAAGVFPSPSWSVDNVSVTVGGVVGQANSAQASLRVNNTGALGLAGPFAETITNTTGLNLTWGGPANQPFILAASVNPGPHVDLGGLGLIGIGTAPTFSDVFVVLDGLSFPTSIYATLDGNGANTMNLTPAGLPSGTVLYVQGLVAQFGLGGLPFVFTAAHQITKL